MLEMKRKQKKILGEYLEDFPFFTKKHITKYHFLNLLRLEKNIQVKFEKKEIEEMFQKFIKISTSEYDLGPLIDYKVQLYMLTENKDTRAKLQKLSQVNCFIMHLIFIEARAFATKEHLKNLYS